MKSSVTDEDPFGSAPFPYKSWFNFIDLYIYLKYKNIRLLFNFCRYR